MKKLLALLAICLCSLLSLANHITGGEMYYTLVSQSGNDYTYRVTLKLYRDCFSTGAPLDASAPISIFSNANNASVWSGNIARSQTIKLDLNSPSPCIQNPPAVCYDVGYYEFNVTLPGIAAGYTITYQRCCRITGINNLQPPSSNVGSTYTAVIPGTSPLATGPANNSARFIGADTVIVCANSSFCYDFGAIDNDKLTFGDSLAYSFCTAYTGGSTGNPAPSPPANPPYTPVPYWEPFRSSSPLGDGVTLNPNTGMMCGIAPEAGIYVITVCVTEYRNGQPIAVQRKDLQIKVGDCNIVKAILPVSYPVCDDFTQNFTNLAPPNNLIHSWYWEFGDGTTSTQANPTHTYLDTGTYIIKLVLNRGDDCADSAYSVARVYPGFFPGFTFSGVCSGKPTQFTDTTRTVYGFVDSWRWDFGDQGSITDISQLRNPTYTYPSMGTRNVELIVTSNKGCIDTVYTDIPIVDKPPLTVAFADTLICNGDTLQLRAIGNGTFTWTPAANVINPNTADPFVHPAVTTRYFVELNDNGCLNQDTVDVRVVDFVTLTVMNDTTICATDSLRLRAGGNGLRYTWTPAATISDPTSPTPMARPDANTSYQVTSRIGHCVATENVNVTLVPYPKAVISPDTLICYETSAQLRATMVGTSFTWSPSSTLDNPNSLTPVASPPATTRYFLSVFDNLGCPKPGRDTVLVTVLPKMIVSAGRDTSVVVGQPLQLTATGGISYLWVPATSLSRNDIDDPVGFYNGTFDSIEYKVHIVDEFGCRDSAFMTVKVFRTDPQIFVPSAFTPNGDGKNDVFRPIAVGITKIEYFRVFNRWGQLVFSTTTNEDGWDGRIGGKEQGTNTYVWVVKAVDYTGKAVFAKGTVTLIR